MGDRQRSPQDGGGNRRHVAAMAMIEEFFIGGQGEAIAEGDDLYQRGEYRAAIRKWQGVLETEELTSGQKEEVSRRIASAYHQRALLSLNDRPLKKNLSRAMTRLQEALRWDADNAYILFDMGRCYLKQGDLEEAEAYMERALHGRGADERIAYHAAALKVRLGRANEALRLIEEWRERGKGVPEGAWMRLRALATAASGRVEEALALLEAPPAGITKEVWLRDIQALCLAAMPSKALGERLETIRDELASAGRMGATERNLVRLLGEVYCALGEDEKAVAVWLEASDARDGEHAARVVSLCERRVVAALREGDYDTAERWCARMVEVSKGDPGILELVARTYLLKGNALWQAGKREGAVEAWRRSSDIQPSLAAAWNLAAAASAAGDWQAAADRWKSVWELASARGDGERARAAALQRSRALLQQGEPKGIEEALEGVIRQNADPSLVKLLGFYLLSTGEYARAVDLFRRLLPEHESDPDVAAGLAMGYDLAGASLETRHEQWEKVVSLRREEEFLDRWRTLTLELAVRTWQAEDRPRAMRLFANLLLRNRDDVDGWVWCGLLHLEQENEKKASDCFDEAIRINPDSAETWIKIGGCYLMTGRQETAEEYFAKACAISPGPGTHLRIAEVCVEVGRQDLAFIHLREGILCCKGPTPDFYRILRLIIEVSSDDQVRSIVEESARVVPESNLVRVLTAVEHLKASEWKAAQEALHQAGKEAASSGDAGTLADVEYFSRALILAMTVGEIQRQEFDRRVVTMVDRWVKTHAPEVTRPSLEELWKDQALSSVASYRAAIEGDVDVRLDPAGTGDLKARFEVEKPKFGQPLNLAHLLEGDPFASLG